MNSFRSSNATSSPRTLRFSAFCVRRTRACLGQPEPHRTAVGVGGPFVESGDVAARRLHPRPARAGRDQRQLGQQADELAGVHLPGLDAADGGEPPAAGGPDEETGREVSRRCLEDLRRAIRHVITKSATTATSRAGVLTATGSANLFRRGDRSSTSCARWSRWL